MPDEHGRLRTFVLKIKRGTSRGRCTEGWNIVRIVDEATGRAFPLECGGGYDMVGSALASWMAITLGPELRRIDRPHSGLSFKAFSNGVGRSDVPDALHAIPILDGAYGCDCMCRIIESCGFEVRERRAKISRDGFLLIERAPPEPPPPPAPPPHYLRVPLTRPKRKILRLNSLGERT